MLILDGGQSQSLREKIEQAPPLAIRFENADDAPLVITDARVKFVKNEESLPSSRWVMGATEAYAFKVNVALTNNTSRKITGLGLQLRNTSENSKFSVYFEHVGFVVALFAERREHLLVLARNVLSLRGLWYQQQQPRANREEAIHKEFSFQLTLAPCFACNAGASLTVLFRHGHNAPLCVPSSIVRRRGGSRPRWLGGML